MNCFKILLSIFFLPMVALAQDADCAVIVQSALTATDNTCEDAGRNEACYGNVTFESVGV